MFAEERYMKIIELLAKQGKATVAELSEALGVSAVTIRRDLEKLEESGKLVRTHGGAILSELLAVSPAAPEERSFLEKHDALADEKERIAEYAATLVEAGESIMLTPGTTNMRIARRLIGKQRLTLVTNAANIATFVTENSEHDVILLGGTMRRLSYALVGALTEASLRQIRVDKLFLGVDGFDLEQGMTTPSLSEASVNRLMLENARQTIVVADRSKFNKVMLSHIAPASAAHAIITDKGLDITTAERIHAASIPLYLV